MKYGYVRSVSARWKIDMSYAQHKLLKRIVSLSTIWFDNDVL
jgi:hypothetical protein